MNISIQGKVGSFSYLATKHLFKEENIAFLERDSFSEVFNDLKNPQTDYAVIPIENSTYGSIYKNFDLLTQNNFYIVAEIYVRVNLHLITNPQTEFNSITEIYVHPVAKEQVSNFLESNPNIKVIGYPDTAGSVEYIKEKKLLKSASIASNFAAKVNNMKILKENIQDNKENFTRFFVLSKINKFNSESNKFTIEFNLGKEYGSLSKVLNIFAKNKIALTKIESRPIINTKWHYTFYLDGIANYNSKSLNKALKLIEKKVNNFRILGFYKEGDYINT